MLKQNHACTPGVSMDKCLVSVKRKKKTVNFVLKFWFVLFCMSAFSSFFGGGGGGGEGGGTLRHQL